METINVVPVLIALLFGGFFGFLFGRTKKGYQVNYTNELPRELFKVVAIDKVSATLETVSPKPVRVLVSTRVFAGKPVRPGQTVRHITSNKECKERNLPVIGCPPLVVVETEEN